MEQLDKKLEAEEDLPSERRGVQADILGFPARGPAFRGETTEVYGLGRQAAVEAAVNDILSPGTALDLSLPVAATDDGKDSFPEAEDGEEVLTAEDEHLGDDMEDPEAHLLRVGTRVKTTLVAGGVLDNPQNPQPSPSETVNLNSVLRDLFELRALGDSETLGERARRFDEFYRKELLSHMEALSALSELFPDVDLLRETDAEKRIYQGMDRELMYSATGAIGHGEWDTARFLDQLLKEVKGKWDARYAFTKAPVFGLGGVNYDAALRCPRTLRREEDLRQLGVREDEIGTPYGAFIYQLMFLQAHHYATANNDGYRGVYLAAQIAAKIANDLGDHCSVEIPPFEKNFPAPVLLLLNEQGPEAQQKARSYIIAMLSLIAPDKAESKSIFHEKGHIRDFANEEFVTFGCIALAVKYGLYEEFKNAFIDLFKVKHAKIIEHFEMREFVQRGPAEQAWFSALDVVEDYQHHTGLETVPRVVDLGCGDALFSQLLIKRGLAKQVLGIDLTDGGSIQVMKPIEGCTIILVPKEPEATRMERISKIINNWAGEAGVDIAFAKDVFHETERHGEYALELYKALKPGGVLYSVDPVSCETLDGLTPDAQAQFDISDYPDSMVPLETRFGILAMLNLRGGEVRRAGGIASAVTSGKNDHFCRQPMTVVKKPDKTFELPSCKLSPKVSITSPEQMMRVWPFNHIPPRHARVLFDLCQRVGGLCPRSGTGPKLTSDSLRRMMILALMFFSQQPRKKRLPSASRTELALSKREQLRALVSKLDAEIDDYIQTCSPYGGFLDDLMRQTYDDSELRETNRRAGEISLLAYLLQQTWGISIIDDIRENLDWKTLGIPAKLNGFAGHGGQILSD
jgi:SAM-dependent methyltransferase